jgi:AhpD family alkylhydroperoxidase
MSEPYPRLASHEFKRLVPGAYPAIDALSAAADAGGLDPSLLELVNLRASQLNGCAYCVQYHTSNLLVLGVSRDKIALVVVWREAGIFSPREAAALAWTEALTLLADTHVPDDVFAEARQVFPDQELASLTAAIAAINVWNRISVAFRYPPAIAS